jgi:hypothetical protein
MVTANENTSRLIEPDELMPKAREVAQPLSKKQAATVRFAKATLNHIDIYEMDANYRLEQDYTDPHGQCRRDRADGAVPGAGPVVLLHRRRYYGR